MSLDPIDLAILGILQKNALATLKDISAEINLSVSPTHDRIKRMEADGVIANYVALINRKKIDLGMVVFCHVTLDKQTKNNFAEFEQIILQFIFKQQGTQVIYLGPNTKLETLAYTIEKLQPTHAFAYLITNFAELDINVYIKTLSRITQNCKLFCGGPGFKDANEIPAKTTVFKNFETLIKTADTIGREN